MSIYQDVYDAKLDEELESILLKLLRFNSSEKVKEPIRKFLYDYRLISDDYWQQFSASNRFENAFDLYYQFSKNKCLLTDTLLKNLNFSIDNVREDATLLMKEAFTF